MSLRWTMIPRCAALGFVSGALGMLTFHQPAVALLDAADLYPVSAFATRPVGPLGVPAVLSGAFWSGLWGVLFAAVLLPALARYHVPTWLAGLLCGATVPILVLFFLLAPLRGFPIAFGMDGTLIAAVVAAHAVWGFGVVVLMAGLPAVFRPRSTR
jgi:hypothetical protein